MPEKLDSRRTSSRRGLVRAGAWTVPAVTIALTAPAYAASRVGYFEFYSGLSYLQQNPAGGYDFVAQGMAIWISGRDLGPNQLTMTVTYEPDPPSTADELAVYAGGPAGFSSETAGTKTTATYVYNLSVGNGDPIWISDGTFFGTAAGSAPTGNLVITLAAPGFQPSVNTFPVPPL